MIWEVPSPVRSAALARPEAVGLVSGDDAWTWCALDDAAARAASRLGRLGVGAGMTVALAGAARGDWVVALFGLMRLGATVAPLPCRATPAELRTAMRALRPDRLVVTSGAAAALSAAAGELPDACRLDHAGLPADPPAPERWASFDDPAVTLLTSGTTGVPAPVRLTWGQLVMSAAGSAMRLPRRPGDRWLCCLPTHHVGGLMILLREAFNAGSVLLHERFDAAEVARALDSGEVAGVSLAPAMLAQILDARPQRQPLPAAVQTVLVGGERLPAALRRRCEEIGAPLVDAWGMTETASHVTLGTPGLPTPFARVEAGEGGRLVVRGPVAAGRVVTGDLGAVGPSGGVTVNGRADDVLTSGGESYHPAEVEDVLAEHPAIGDAAVGSADDARWGQRPAAVLVQAQGAERPSDEELSQWCRGRLSRHKLPVRFEWTERLPRKMADA